MRHVHCYVVEVTRPGHKTVRVFDNEKAADQFYGDCLKAHGETFTFRWEV